MTSSSNDVTGLLQAWGNGDKEALDTLMPLVYAELRRLAKRHLLRERPDHSLETTGLMHEACIRLLQQKKPGWQTRAQFFSIAARLMRRILVDHARARQTAKRGGPTVKVSFAEAETVGDRRSAEVLALDDALERLAEMDPRRSRVVELRFFGGLSVEETADVLGVSANTVIRDWGSARAWLHRELNRETVGGS